MTGFFDAEGCFHISITTNKTCKIGWQVKACFAVSLVTKDLALLKRIQSYFCGVGEINKCGKNAYQYRVTSPQGTSQCNNSAFYKFSVNFTKTC